LFNPFKELEVEEWFVNNMPYEKIVMSGKGYVSTEALSLLSQHNRNLILVDTYGRATTYLNPVMESLTATRYSMGQYDTFKILKNVITFQGRLLKQNWILRLSFSVQCKCLPNIAKKLVDYPHFTTQCLLFFRLKIRRGFGGIEL
jgi:hypothetical protein